MIFINVYIGNIFAPSPQNKMLDPPLELPLQIICQSYNVLTTMANLLV